MSTPATISEGAAGPTDRWAQYLLVRRTLTDQQIDGIFGPLTKAAVEEFQRKSGLIVDAAGHDVYLPSVTRLAIPISTIHGGQNHCFLPESTERTLASTSTANGTDLYDRRVIPGYGHIDCIFRQEAVRDVCPYTVERLDLHADRRG